MAKWWESERSKLAAAVRSTRKRLRAGFRGAVADRVAHIKERLERERQADHYALAEQTRQASEAVHAIWRGKVMVREFEMSKTLVVQLTLDHQLFMRAASTDALVREIARSIAKGVEKEVIALHHNTRTEAIR